MPLLNYTTEVPVARTMGQIQGLLIGAKAQKILTEFTPEGRVSALSFQINSNFGILSIRMPAKIQACYKILAAERSRSFDGKKLFEQAERIAWRIVKDWLEAQLAMIRVKQAEIEQVFLPYIQDPQTGQTVYEKLAEQQFSGLALPAPKS